HGEYSYYWSNGVNGKDVVVNPMQAESYQVTAVDECGTEAVTTINVDFEEHESLVAAEFATISFDCEGNEVVIKPEMSGVKGGVGRGYTYSFDQWGKEKRPLTVLAEIDAQFEVEISDACGIQ